MEIGNLEELRAMVIKKGIINQEGVVSATAMNFFSGMYTSSLLDEVWGLAFHNTETMDKLFGLMKQSADAGKHEALGGILNK